MAMARGLSSSSEEPVERKLVSIGSDAAEVVEAALLTTGPTPVAVRYGWGNCMGEMQRF